MKPIGLPFIRKNAHARVSPNLRTLDPASSLAWSKMRFFGHGLHDKTR